MDRFEIFRCRHKSICKLEKEWLAVTEQLAIAKNRTAVVLMDYQKEIVEKYGGESGDTLERVNSVLKAARSSGIPVIYVAVRFRAGHPEISPRNRLFAPIKAAGRLVEGTPEADIHPAVAPEPGDVVMSKRRISAFTGSDLRTVLTAHGVDTLILMGIATSGVVLSTVCEAADLDYTVIVVSDGCLDRDPEVHKMLLEKPFAWRASVVDSRTIVSAILSS